MCRDIQYKNCSVQHSQVSAKHTFQARLPHSTTLLFTTGMILPSKESHSNTGCDPYAWLLKKYTFFFPKLSCASTIIFNATVANL